VLKGLLLKESLKDDSILKLVRITHTETWNVENAADHQPAIWTALYFEIEDEQADAFAEKLSRVLHARGWYVNGSTDTQVYVIFPGKVFRYPIGDLAQRTAAQQFGRTLGIPEPQLDWGE
jgi:hypothetical protein